MNEHRAAFGNQRGMVMLIVIVVLMAVSLLGLASVMVVSLDLRIAGHYRQSDMAFWAAEAGVQRSLGELRDDRTYLGDIEEETLNNNATSSAAIEQFSGFISRIEATGVAGTAVRRIEVLINVDSAFESAINVGGDLTLVGKPRVSAEGVRLNGDGYVDLDDGTPELNIYQAPGHTMTAPGNNTNLNVTEKAPMDLAAIKLRDDEWRTLAGNAHSSFYFDDNGTWADKDSPRTITNLDFDDVPVGTDGNRTIFVDGDLVLNGTISGIGTIVATGKIIGEGGFVTSQTPTITMVAMDDVLLNFDTEAQSQLNGLVYTEGDYELHGKIKYTGVVTAFGSVNIQNPSEFTNNNDSNYWFTYSSAYNIISDPIDVLSWTDLQG